MQDADQEIQPTLNQLGQMEKVRTFKYLGIQLTKNLSWTNHIKKITVKTQQRLCFLRHLARFRFSLQVFKTFYMGTIKSLLAGNISAWFGNAIEQDRKALSRVVCSATKGPLPALQDICGQHCRTRGRRKDTSHLYHGLFSVLHSGKRCHCLRTKTKRLRKSFFPHPVSKLNKDTSQRFHPQTTS